MSPRPGDPTPPGGPIGPHGPASHGRPTHPTGPIGPAEVAALEAALRRALPRFDVRYKEDSRLQRLIGALLRPFNDRYLSHYTTVMFGVVWFPSRAWRAEAGPAAIYEILAHEAVHLRDARRFPVLFELSYLLLLPTGITARAFWEWRAYRETLRVHAALHGHIPDSLLGSIERRFTGPDYLFMWPFPRMVRRALERARAEALAERAADPPRDAGVA